MTCSTSLLSALLSRCQRVVTLWCHRSNAVGRPGSEPADLPTSRRFSVADLLEVLRDETLHGWWLAFDTAEAFVAAQPSRTTPE